MTIDLKFDQECSRCDGYGRSFVKNNLTTCPDCDGVGRRLTEHGDDLIEFLKRHRKTLKEIMDAT